MAYYCSPRATWFNTGQSPQVPDVWVGETKACIIDWPPLPFGQPLVTPDTTPPYVPPPVQPHTHYHFERPAQLSDADVERIAKRVAELLRQSACDPDAERLLDEVEREIHRRSPP